MNLGLVNLIGAIASAIEVVQPAADAKAIQLESVLDTSVEPIWGDSDRLQQVVWNLSNAINVHTRKPDVLVSDIGMPGEDGYALIRKVRELEPDMGGRIPALCTDRLCQGRRLHRSSCSRLPTPRG